MKILILKMDSMDKEKARKKRILKENRAKKKIYHKPKNFINEMEYIDELNRDSEYINTQ